MINPIQGKSTHGRNLRANLFLLSLLLLNLVYSPTIRADNPPLLQNTVPSTDKGFVKIVIDAKDFESHTPRSDRQWGSHPSCPGGLMAIPNLWDEHVFPSDFMQNSPELIYSVDIPTTENYVVWFHAMALDWRSNSAHVAVVNEKQKANSESDIENHLRMRICSLRSWVWTRCTLGLDVTQPFKEQNGPNAILRLQAGKSKLHVWMQEDGFCFDKIVLVNDFGYDPTEEFGSLVGKRITSSK